MCFASVDEFCSNSPNNTTITAKIYSKSLFSFVCKRIVSWLQLSRQCDFWYQNMLMEIECFICIVCNIHTVLVTKTVIVNRFIKIWCVWEAQTHIRCQRNDQYLNVSQSSSLIESPQHFGLIKMSIKFVSKPTIYIDGNDKPTQQECSKNFSPGGSHPFYPAWLFCKHVQAHLISVLISLLKGPPSLHPCCIVSNLVYLPRDIIHMYTFMLLNWCVWSGLSV